MELETGEELTIVGTRNGSDFARVDFVELLPRDIFSTISDSTVAALPEEMSEFG